jgi:hypothetical protein
MGSLSFRGNQTSRAYPGKKSTIKAEAGIRRVLKRYASNRLPAKWTFSGSSSGQIKPGYYPEPTVSKA